MKTFVGDIITQKFRGSIGVKLSDSEYEIRQLSGYVIAHMKFDEKQNHWDLIYDKNGRILETSYSRFDIADAFDISLQSN